MKFFGFTGDKFASKLTFAHHTSNFGNDRFEGNGSQNISKPQYIQFEEGGLHLVAGFVVAALMAQG